MPKYTKPKDPCGLSLRAVIEGELMNALGLDYYLASNAATVIEARIQAGPSDWLALSDGTTFEKTWVPGVKPTFRHSNPFGDFGNKNLIPDQSKDSVERVHEDSCGMTGRPNVAVSNCKMTCACWCHGDQVLRATAKIHAAHEERVKTNFERASSLSGDIKSHELWLQTFGSSRIFIQ